jgi:hypothetical protein
VAGAALPHVRGSYACFRVKFNAGVLVENLTLKLEIDHRHHLET